MAEGQTEVKVCAIERSYPNVDVGQILKRYLEYSYKHFSKLKRRTRTWVQMTKYDLCWGLTTRQLLWVILCRLPEKGRKEIEEIVKEMKEMNREERGTGMKVKKQKK